MAKTVGVKMMIVAAANRLPLDSIAAFTLRIVTSPEVDAAVPSLGRIFFPQLLPQNHADAIEGGGDRDERGERGEGKRR